MRLFVAAELDETVRRQAAATVSRLREAGDADNRRAVSWVATANLHFTLQFIGEVDASDARRIGEQLSPPFALPPFDIVVHGVGAFPSAGQPRVIWLGVAEGGALLGTLARAVNDRLDAIGIPHEDRPFRAHLTAGRVKAPIGARLHASLAELRQVPVGRCSIDHVTLFESHLSPRGSTYSVVVRSPLGYHPSA